MVLDFKCEIIMKKIDINKNEKNNVPMTANLKYLIEHYDGFIVDIWGVIHNGGKIFEGVISALQHIQERGKTVVFLSNSPRSSGQVLEVLEDKGLSPSLYKCIISSGELFEADLVEGTLPLVKQHCCPRIFFIDENPDLGAHQPVYSKVPFNQRQDHYVKVDALDFADCIAIITMDNELENYHKYKDMLEHALHLHLPMICVNADMSVFKDRKEYLRPGYMAKDYHEMGGEVHLYGKPGYRMFETAIKELAPLPLNKIVSIGDTVLTDVQGAIMHNNASA